MNDDEQGGGGGNGQPERGPLADPIYNVIKESDPASAEYFLEAKNDGQRRERTGWSSRSDVSEAAKIVRTIDSPETQQQLRREGREVDPLTEIHRQVNRLITFAHILGSQNPQLSTEILEELRPLRDLNNVEELQNRFEPIAAKLEEGLAPFEHKDPREYINSMEDLAELIMLQAEPKWNRGGELELIDEKGDFHPENFLAWLRERALYWDDFNPDSEINLFSEIGIPTLYRSITFQEMLSTDKYFRRKRTLPTGEAVYEKSEQYEDLKWQALYDVWLFMMNHNYDAKYRANSGNEENLQKTLAEIHYNNVFTRTRDRFLRMFKSAGISELADPSKKAWAGERQDFQGSVGKIMQRSLLAYMYLPDRDMFKQVFTHKDGGKEGLDAFYQSVVEQVFKEKVRIIREEKFNEKRENFLKEFREKQRREPTSKEIDDAIGKTEVDIFGTDRKRFFELLNQDQNRPGENHYYKKALEMSEGEFNDLVDRDKEYFARKAIFYRYGNTGKDELDKEGNVKTDRFRTWAQIEEDKLNRKDVRDHALREDAIDGPFSIFNMYSDVNFEQPRKDIIRNAVKAGIRKMMGAPVDDKDKERKELDIKWGETWAFKETYWTGIAAYNDIGAISFDKWGQELNTGGYRRRQAAGRGPSGIEETIWGIERLNLNLWQGLKVREQGGRDFDRILLEVIQGGQGNIINLDRDISDFDFQDNAQRQYMVDHISAGFLLAKHLIDQHGMDFDQLFKYDGRGKLLIDYKRFEEVVRDRVWHDLRYCYDQRAFLWDNKIRSWWREEDPETGEQKLHFGAKDLRHHMFDEEVLKTREEVFERADPKPDADGNPTNPDYNRRIEDEARNNAMARGVFAYLIGKELKWHIKDKPGVVRWGPNEVSLVKEAFKEWALGYEKDPETGEVKSLGPFYSEDEWEDIIAELGDATEEKLRMNLILYLMALFVGSIIWGSVKESRKVVTEAYKAA